MNTEQTLFNIDDETVSPTKKPVKKAPKTKKSTSLYAGFTAQEIMEYFDWGVMFPNAYLPELLGENDLQTRFESLKFEYVVLLVEKPTDSNYYYLEFDISEVDVFLSPLKEGIYYSESPIPIHLVKKIICADAKSKKEFSRLWALTDNDEMAFETTSFEQGTTEPLHVYPEPSQQKKERMLQFIKQLDRILGAICFTKGLDPFIEFNFPRNREKEQDPLPVYTTSPRFLWLLKQWMPKKSKNMFETIESADPDNEKKYAVFFEKLVSGQWDDSGIDTILKSIHENDKADAILSQVLDNPADDEQKHVYQKIKRALKEIDLGIVDIQTALQDEDLKRSNAVFLILLKMYYRRGKSETDALGFRTRLFEKDFIKSPKQVSLIGTLYGYYTGYHNLRKKDNITSLGEVDISTDEKISNIFRLKLSPNDNFESEALNVFYNRLSENYADINIPQVKINFTTPKEPPGNELIGQSPNTRMNYVFTPVPVLGKYGFSIEPLTTSNKAANKTIDKAFDKALGNSVDALIDRLTIVLKQRQFKVAASVVVMTYLKSEQIPNASILRNVLLEVQKGEINIELDIDLPALKTALDNHLSMQKDNNNALANIEKLSKVINSFTNQ